MVDTREFGHITEEAASAAFDQLGDIYRGGAGTGFDLNSALAAMVGDSDSYNALIFASERFMRENPGFFEGRIAAPEAAALWAGLVVGTFVRRPE